MTNHPPETMLAAARIVDQERDWVIRNNLVVYESSATCQVWIFDPDGEHHRALREALDKEYGITIQWSIADNKWISVSCIHAIDAMLDEDIENLMLRNVQALMDAGVLNE